MRSKRRAHRRPVSSHPHWKTVSLSAITAFVSVVAGNILFATLFTETVSAAPLVDELKLPGDHACGTVTATFQATTGAPKRTVFKLNDDWHTINPCLKSLRNAANNQNATAPIHQFLYYQTLYVLSQPDVQFSDLAGTKDWTLKNVVNKKEELDLGKIQRLTYLSDMEEAYDGMGQTDFAIWALSAYKTVLEKKGTNPYHGEVYKALAMASMEVVAAPAASGGLRSQSTCGLQPMYMCSWFHSKTSSAGSAEDGMTLNKHLHVVRDLYDFAQDLKNLSVAESQTYADKYSAAAVEGMHQLVYATGIKGGVAPNLFDFVARKPNGEAIQNSWLYYGYSPSGSGYFLKKTPAKNCGYHKRDINLLVSLFDRMGGLVDTTGFTTPPVGGNLNKSILVFIVRAYELKVEDGLYKDSKTSTGGNFLACGEDIGSPITDADLAYLRSL